MKNDYKIIKTTINDKEITVKQSLVDNSFLLSANDICLLFEKSKSTVSKRIKEILSNNKSIGNSGVSKIATTGLDGKEYNITHYDLGFVDLLSISFKSNASKLLRDTLTNKTANDVDVNQDSIIYNNGNVCIDVKISPLEDTVWLTQNQIAELFETSRQNVGSHIKNIVEEGELSVGKNSLPTGQNDSICKELVHTSSDGKNYIVNYYNLDMILAIGYRIKGERAIQFRKWASTVLKQYLMKGYALNKDRIPITLENVYQLEHEVSDIKNESISS